MRPDRTRLTFVLGMVTGAALIAIVMYYMNVAPTDLCDHKTIKEFSSPNNKRVAAVVLSNCGATTPFVTSVEVKNIGEKQDIDYLFSVKGKNDMEVVWNDGASFTIVYQRPTRVYRQVLVWRTERIGYREKQ